MSFPAASDEPASHPMSARRLLRRFGARYLAVLAAVAALVIVDQAVVQPLLARLGEFAPVINVAGRQRMLSQRLAKAALAQRTAADDAAWLVRQRELGETLDQWRAAHAALRDHAPALRAQEIQSAWAELEPHFQAMGVAADGLSAASYLARDREAAHVATLLHHEPSYLATMDRIVKLLEAEAAHEVTWLRRVDLAIGATIVALLLGLGVGVVYPAMLTIRRQVESLEDQVAARTADLRGANAALRHEIAERESAEANQQRLAAQLAHASRVSTMGHLTAGLAHELNQPLCTIANFAAASELSLEQMDERPAEVSEHLRQIEQAALRAGRIVKRMRDFVRPQPTAAETLDLLQLNQEVMEFCRTEIVQAEIDARVDAPDIALPVRVDRVQIQQVVVNLLQNAIDAMRELPKDRRQILLRITACDAEARIEVHDDGPGFDTAAFEALFQPFHTTKSGGLGIGLTIAQSIVEHHRGHISAASSTCLRGALVAFSLPLAPAYDTASAKPSVRVCCGR